MIYVRLTRSAWLQQYQRDQQVTTSSSIVITTLRLRMTILSDIFSLITWWHCQCDEDVSVYQRSQWIANSLITCNHDSHTEIDYFTRYFFISYWHQHVINLLHKLIVTVRRSVVTWMKTLHDNFSDHAMF